MKRQILILLGLISTLSIYSQNKVFSVNRIVSEFYVDTIYTQIDFQYSNISDSTLVLWIEKSNIDSLTDSQVIKKHFFTNQGDFSLMQIIWDGNVGSYIPGLFDSFIKVIKPKELFTVSIIKKGKISPYFLNSLKKQVVIVKAGDIKGFRIDDSINMFNYKSNSIIILYDWIE